MTTVARPLVRAGPGVAAWTALPERDRALLLWLVQGDVVTAELAALLAYGHLRIAQRRLAKLVGYGLLMGFWAANRQPPTRPLRVCPDQAGPPATRAHGLARRQTQAT